MQTFKASTHYQDWKGTATADDDAPRSFGEYLRKKGLIRNGEFLVGLSVGAADISSGGPGVVSVRAYLFDGPENAEAVREKISGISGPVPVRIIIISMEVDEFFAEFKAFEVMLLWGALQGAIEGREFRETFMQ